MSDSPLRELSVGTAVAITLKTGHVFSGVLSELGDSYVILKNPLGTDVVTSLDLVECWIVEGRALDGAPYGLPAGVEARLMEVEAKVKAAAEQPPFPPFAPDFKEPKESFVGIPFKQRAEAQQEWSRLCNQYHYAARIRDQERLTQLASRFPELLKKFPTLSMAHYNIGCLYLELDRVAEAAEAFERYVFGNHDPKGFYNLAVAALRGGGDEAKARGALKLFFDLALPSGHEAAWYRFLKLTAPGGQPEELLGLVEREPGAATAADARLVLEGIVWRLKTAGRVRQAYRILARLDTETLAPTDLGALLDEVSGMNGGGGRTAARRRSAPGERAPQGPPRDSHEAPLRPATAAPGDSEAVYSSVVDEPGEAGSAQAGARAKGPYALAREALKPKRSPERAESLLREAITLGDSAEAALRDLVLLMRQQGRHAEALQFLRDQGEKVADSQTVQFLLATLYQDLERYSDAVTALYRLLAVTPEKKQHLIRNRIAICHIKAGDFTHAREVLQLVLRSNPQDMTAYKLLEMVSGHAQAAGPLDLSEVNLDSAGSDAMGLTDFSSGLSKFLLFYLENCEYRGVTKTPDGSFSEDDIEKLRELIEAAGRSRAGLRAQYSLSVARLMRDLEVGNEQRFTTYLQEFAADMGEACLLEQKHKDAVLAFYLEAFAVAPKLSTKLREKLPHVIMLFYASRDEIIVERPSSLETCLAEALGRGDEAQALIEWLLSVSLLTPLIDRYLLPKIYEQEELRLKVQSVCEDVLGRPAALLMEPTDLTRLWKRAAERLRAKNKKVINEMLFLQKSAEKLDSLREQREAVKRLTERLRGSLDRQRLRDVADILQQVIDYDKQHHYVERERLAAIIRGNVAELVERIKEEPTKISLELFRPYVQLLDNTIREHFEKVQQAAEPEELENRLALESYIPDANMYVGCQLTVRNPPGKSPASDVSIRVEEALDGEYVPRLRDVPVTEALQGGQAMTIHLPLTLTQKTVLSRAFTLRYVLCYTTRAGRQVRLPATAPIRLGDEANFEQIHNHYASWAETGEVTDPDMFYGRDLLIANLVSAIRNAPQAKSVVVYGQKRAGKSSVLYHLSKQLDLPIIPIKFSLGDVVNGLSVATFLYRTVQCLDRKFKELVGRGLPKLGVAPPAIEALERGRSPELRFYDYMEELRQAMGRFREYDGVRIMLLIDEFSYLYGEIKRERLPESFMKFWKALLQQGYFGAVVVGQDVMSNFIECYPNEFQVAQSERVSYLTEADASDLIVNPIRIPGSGESRFVGEAVKRVLELTAGSPFYIQIFCNRLVEYMNRKKLVRVTDADIDQVTGELIRGTNSLTKAKFDNLISAGDDVTNVVPKEDVLAVLRDVAAGMRTQEYCDRSQIVTPTTASTNTIIEDLVRREVLEARSPAMYRIRVGLFKEWLLCH